MHCLGYSEYKNKDTKCWQPDVSQDQIGNAVSNPHCIEKVSDQAMSFELGENRNQLGRLKDDSCELNYINKESKNPGLYRISGVQQANSNVYMEHPTLNFGQLENRGINPCCIDDESELFNLPRKDSKCPTKKYNPKSGSTKNGCIKFKENPQIIPESTRLQKSCDISSGHSILDYQFNELCDNPQGLDKIHSNNFIGKNSRLSYKDNYKQNFVFKTRHLVAPSGSNTMKTSCCSKKNEYSKIGESGALSSSHDDYIKKLKAFKKNIISEAPSVPFTLDSTK